MIDVNDKDLGFKASYIRTNEWKLLINSSLSFVEIPSNKYWVNYDDVYTKEPPKDIYQDMMNNDELNKLFESHCYDNYINDIKSGYNDEPSFEYDEIMLFKISKDNIEACNVAKKHPEIVKDLLNHLLSDDNIEQYIEFNSDPIRMSKQGSLAQIESYSCNTKKAYHLSWNEVDKYSDENNVALSWNEIFEQYINTVDSCNIPKAAAMNALYHLDHNGAMRALIVCIATISLISYLWTISRIFKNTWKQNTWPQTKSGKNRQEIGNGTDEFTALLPPHV